MEVPDCLMPSLHYLEKAVFFLFKKKKKKSLREPKRTERKHSRPSNQPSSQSSPCYFPLGFMNQQSTSFPFSSSEFRFCHQQPQSQRLWGGMKSQGYGTARARRQGTSSSALVKSNSKIYSHLREDKRERGRRKAGGWSQDTSLLCRGTQWALRSSNDRGFPGSPVTKTPRSQCREPGLNLWPGIQTPHATTKTLSSQINNKKGINKNLKSL